MINRGCLLLCTVLCVAGPGLSAPAVPFPEDDPCVVTVEGGKISGLPAAPGSRVRVFRGIPFARPPVGPWRWKPPQRVEPWEGVRDCTAFGPACVQPAARIVPEVREKRSEDCLYVNVWTAARGGEGRPVMVWIHGGGFAIGSGALRFYDGRRFAEDGVVLVTINYRLGPFGFLAHPALSAESPHHVSGNYGLLDQVAALEWVRRNIAAFGGDPGKVTIFGESAGALSVACLMAMPRARGLFHRAVLQSGTAEGLAFLREAKGWRPAAEAQGIAVARVLAIEEPDSAAPDTAAALRAASAEALLEAADPRVGLFGKGRSFWPVVDGHVLPRSPEEAMVRGEIPDVPVLLGVNADEGTLFLRQLPVKRAAGYRLLVRSIFGGDADRVLEAFPAPSSGEVGGVAARLVTVACFVAPMRRCARRLARRKHPAWVYRFTRVSPGAKVLGLGATHGGEIPYVFGTLPPAPWSNDADIAVSAAMHGAWVRFADTGDPGGEGLPPWPAWTSEEEKVLEFGDTLRVREGLGGTRCDLFDALHATGERTVRRR